MRRALADFLRRVLVALDGGRPTAASPSPGEGSPPQRSSDKLRTALSALQEQRPVHPRAMITPISHMPRTDNPFKIPEPLFKLPEGKMAMDSALVIPGVESAYFNEGIGFFGYQVLAQLSQRAEYRKMVEIIALDMTREWVRFSYTGDQDKGHERIREIEKRFNELQVKDKFRQAMELDGFFGRGHIHINLGDTNDKDELKTPLLVDPRKIKKGSLRRLTVVDPTWTYPGVYNTTDPLNRYFYSVETWYVMNKEVHETRLLTFVSRPVPDILKAPYMFGGLSITQMAKPYVDNWLNMRQSVADLVQAFSVFVLKTDMSNVLNGSDAASLQARADLFNFGRVNSGLMLVNKGEAQGDPGEELTNVSVPLSGLNELLSAAQEQQAAVAGIPLVKLLGVTPSGLNASSDGEVRVYYDSVAAAQERLFRAPLETLLQIVQIDLFGDVDENVGIEFLPLWQLDETQLAAARKSDADVDVNYVNAGVLSPEEVREKLAADKTSPWANLDTSDVPENPAEALAGASPFGEGEEDDSEQAQDERVRDTYRLHGFDIVIETPKGRRRVGRGPQGDWECVMAADYGYIEGTWSSEGRAEGMDCFVGDRRDSRKVFVIDQADPWTGQFDEHKLVFGCDTAVEALGLYAESHDGDARVSDRVMDVTELTVDALRHWLETGDLYRPISDAARDVKTS